MLIHCTWNVVLLMLSYGTTLPPTVLGEPLSLPNWQEENVCNKGGWQCRTGRQCIQMWAICDDNSRNHCIDNSDKWGCDEEFKCAPSSEDEAFPCEHTFCNMPGIPVCDPNQQFEYKVKVNEEIKIECKMLNKDDEHKVRWEFNTYEPGIEYLQSTEDILGTAYLTVKPKSSFDYGSLRCYSYNETNTSCPCEYTIMEELENINEGEDSFFSPTQDYINIIEGETLDENITCNINLRGKANEISWWKVEEKQVGNTWDDDYEAGKMFVNEVMLSKGRKILNSFFYMEKNEYVEYDEEIQKWAQYKLFMRFSTYVNESAVYNSDEGVYQCRVWNPDTNVTIIQNVTLNVKVTCKTRNCDSYRNDKVCKEGVGRSDAVCKCKDGYREERDSRWGDLNCRETCASKACPENSQCDDNGGTSYPVCECTDGYVFSDDFCHKTCDLKSCGRFENCVSDYRGEDLRTCSSYNCVSDYRGGAGECACKDGYTYHKNICIDHVFMNSTQDAIISYNRLMLNPVSLLHEMYQRILQDRMIVRDIYMIILSNYLPDFNKQELSCLLKKTSNDRLAQNITAGLVPVRLISKALHAGKQALQTLYINKVVMKSIPESCNDAYKSFVNKKCGKNICIKMFSHCVNFLDESMEHWNLLMDEINKMIKNWKSFIINENKIKESIIQSLIENHELQMKIQECAPTKDLVIADPKIKLSQYRFTLKFGKLEQYIMSQLEKRVISLRNINMKIVENICENLLLPTENCIDSDINIDISSHKPISSSPEIAKLISTMTNKLRSYNQDLPVDIDECESFDFKCGDGSCISSELKCDGYKDCSNGLDEGDQFCRKPDKLICPEGGNVASRQICDGKWNCADGSDETFEICSKLCTPPFFRIRGECILEVKEKTNWHQAKKGCESRGLKFAQIHTIDNELMRKNTRNNYMFWVDSYFQPTEGFKWPDTGLRINGTSDPHRVPYHPCLKMFILYDQPFGYYKCSDNLYYLCEKETFDVAETVPLSYFGAPDGFEWIGEHLVMVPGRGTLDSSNYMTWTEALEWCQQDNFKPFVPDTTEQWEDMRWLFRKYQHNLQRWSWLPAIDKHFNNNFTWYNGEVISDEWIHYWTLASKQELSSRDPFSRTNYWDKDGQCLTVYGRSVALYKCNATVVPMICEYTGDIMEAKVPIQKKKEMVCSDTFNITSDTDTYEIDFRKIRGNEGATSQPENRKNTPHEAWGYHGLTYLYWKSRRNENLSSNPEALWYQFPVPITVIKYAFQTIREGFHSNYAPLYGPSKYEFFGSTSTNCSDQSTWETLFVDNSGTPFNSTDHVKTETLDNTRTFRCYGFKVTEVPSPGYVMISGVRFWVAQDNWIRIGGESFRPINRRVADWYEARRICKCLGADLAQPEDPYYVVKYLGKHAISYSTGSSIGATDLAREGDWRWLNGGSVEVKLENDEQKNCLLLGMKPASCYTYYYTTQPMCERNDVQHTGLKPIVFGLRGQYFVVVKKILNWNDARSFCQNLGGDLAVPKDINLLRNYLLKQELIYDYWLGAKYESNYVRQGMTWVNGEKVDFKHIPSDYVGEKGQYFDFQILKYPAITEDIRSPSEQYFICETAAMMPDYVDVQGSPYEFEKCRPNWNDDLKCLSGGNIREGCFSPREKCNGRNDCNDGSDEKYCGFNINIYIKVGSQNYLVKEDILAWQNASKLCNYAGGHLAEPKDLLKLKNFLTENYSHLNYWLGGSDLSDEDTWVWESGTPIESGWADNEPGAILKDQDCLLFNSELYHDKSLSASQCQDKKAFVCEYSENN